MDESPRAIIVDIRGEAQLAAGFQNTRRSSQKIVRHDTTLVMPAFWPWIGIEKLDPVERSSRQRRKQIPGVATVNTDIGQAAIADGGDGFGDAVQKRLASEKGDVWLLARLLDEALAVAEPDLKSSLNPRKREKRIQRQRAGHINGHQGQKIRHQPVLALAELLSLSAAVQFVQAVDLSWL